MSIFEDDRTEKFRAELVKDTATSLLRRVWGMVYLFHDVEFQLGPSGRSPGGPVGFWCWSGLALVSWV